MNYAWMCPIVLEKALNDDPSLVGTFSPSGDSMIYVNQYGKRVTNEKLAYNESAQAFFSWDPATSQYPNLALAAIWDARSQRYSASTEYGRFIVPEGVNDAHVIKGDTLAELAQKIRERVAQLAPQIGNLNFGDDFEANLPATARRTSFQRSDRPRTIGAESDNVSACRQRALLRSLADGRQPRYQRRSGNQSHRTGARSYGQCDCRPVWRRQLRRIGVGTCLLGGRGHAGSDSGVRLSRGAQRAQRASALKMR
jgi:hypothetical protein